VVLFQERGLARDSIYVVRNPWHQDLGLIDGHGRAYRYVPHLEEPVWVGSGTVSAGARAILGLADDCELIEIEEELKPVLTPTSADSGTNPLEPAPIPQAAPLADGGLPQSR
jgi:hypothetical protein